MSDSSLNEFNRLLHGRELSDEELAYEYNQKREADELLQDYGAMFGEKEKGDEDDKERIARLEEDIVRLTEKINEQEEHIQQLTHVIDTRAVSTVSSEMVDSKGCCGWVFARSS
jgi:peptidoglycan hydrolase CwlO-like protein